jgi:hypothetical protein
MLSERVDPGILSKRTSSGRLGTIPAVISLDSGAVVRGNGTRR